jgi:hypothetical protein
VQGAVGERGEVDLPLSTMVSSAVAPVHGCTSVNVHPDGQVAGVTLPAQTFARALASSIQYGSRSG